MLHSHGLTGLADENDALDIIGYVHTAVVTRLAQKALDHTGKTGGAHSAILSGFRVRVKPDFWYTSLVNPSKASVLATALVSAFLLPIAAQAQKEGTLVLQGDAGGAQVIVDGVLIGELPLEPFPLAKGSHSLRIEKPGFTEYAEVIQIQAGRPTVIEVELYALSMIIDLETVPDKARIFVDGKYVGKSPIQLDLLPGEHVLEAKAERHHAVKHEVSAAAGIQEPLLLELDKFSEEEIAALEEQQEPGWYEEPAVWLAVGGGVLVAAGTVILIAALGGSSPSQLDTFCEAGCERLP